jgi:hypothetical protein
MSSLEKLLSRVNPQHQEELVSRRKQFSQPRQKGEQHLENKTLLGNFYELMTAALFGGTPRNRLWAGGRHSSPDVYDAATNTGWEAKGVKVGGHCILLDK